jgi:CheY-like chemotaxis protein
MAHRILLVEDDAFTADIVSGLLKARGNQVDVVCDGMAAINGLFKGGYDLAQIDYHLPEVDGCASARVVG